MGAGQFMAHRQTTAARCRRAATSARVLHAFSVRFLGDAFTQGRWRDRWAGLCDALGVRAGLCDALGVRREDGCSRERVLLLASNDAAAVVFWLPAAGSGERGVGP